MWECESVKCEFCEFVRVRMWELWKCESVSVRVLYFEKCEFVSFVSLGRVACFVRFRVPNVSFRILGQKCVFWVWQHFVSRLGYLLRCKSMRFLSFLSWKSKVSVLGSNKGFSRCEFLGGWGFEKLKTPVLLSLGFGVGRVLTWLVYVRVCFENVFLRVVPVFLFVFPCWFGLCFFEGSKTRAVFGHDIWSSFFEFCIYISSSVRLGQDVAPMCFDPPVYPSFLSFLSWSKKSSFEVFRFFHFLYVFWVF